MEAERGGVTHRLFRENGDKEKFQMLLQVLRSKS